MADPSDTLFTVADLSRLGIELDIFERDLARLREAQPVAVAVTSYAGVIGIGPAVLVHEGSTLVVMANALRLLAYRGAER